MNKQTRVIYLAGPFRAKTPWEIELNVRRAEAASLEIWRMGAACICPHTMTRHFQDAAPDEVWIKGDIELLHRCDAVFIVATQNQDGRVSSGTSEEIFEAHQCGIPVFHTLTGLAAWLKQQ